MGRPIADTERQAILDLLPTGKSCRQIADEVGRSPNTVARVAKSVGHQWGRVNLARAASASKAYGAERRAERLAKIDERISRILERMGQPHTAFNFGGKDNTLATLELDEPDSDALRQYASAVAQLSRAEMEVVKHDERADGDVSAVDDWLRDRIGGE